MVRESADRLTTLTANNRKLITQPAPPCQPAIWEEDREAAALDPRGLRAGETRGCQVLGDQGSGRLGTGRKRRLNEEREGGIGEGREQVSESGLGAGMVLWDQSRPAGFTGENLGSVV